MPRYEFKVIPAPRKGEKSRGVKTVEDRFALALTHLMNEQGREGWDYVRADTLPVDERVGFTGTKTTFQNMLVFRRQLQPVAVAEPVTPPHSAAPILTATAPEGPAPKLVTETADAPAFPALGPARSAETASG